MNKFVQYTRYVVKKMEEIGFCVLFYKETHDKLYRLPLEQDCL